VREALGVPDEAEKVLVLEIRGTTKALSSEGLSGGLSGFPCYVDWENLQMNLGGRSPVCASSLLTAVRLELV
jgi:hypothetical protein